MTKKESLSIRVTTNRPKIGEKSDTFVSMTFALKGSRAALTIPDSYTDTQVSVS